MEGTKQRYDHVTQEHGNLDLPEIIANVPQTGGNGRNQTAL
jgi:hypothetical protein